MERSRSVLWGWAYIGGLLAADEFGLAAAVLHWPSAIAVAAVLAIAGGVAAATIPRRWRRGPQPTAWVTAGAIAALAVIYLHARVPQPGPTDISRLFQPLSESSNGVTAPVNYLVGTVQGRVLTIPRQSRADTARFELAVEEFERRDGPLQTVGGRLYVKVPRVAAADVLPGRTIAVTGGLYRPRRPANPGAFDFSAYLARRGIFAGLSADDAEAIAVLDRAIAPGWWQLRRRISSAFVRGVESPRGETIASVTLGRRATDLPPEVSDRFIRVGLAHVLAASGFHVALLLAAVLAATQRFVRSWRVGIGLGVLMLYAGLTGASPSVLRAAFMGAVVLVAMAGDRKVNAVGSLLLAAVLLLLVNPLWIADLGFQLSFLSALGLLVTVEPIAWWLNWLPVRIAGIVAVPVAVLPWVLPLQLHAFGVVAPYSIVASIITTPLVILVSYGGMLGAAAAAIWPVAGSAIAWIVQFPTLMLLGVVSWLASLPGSTQALGTIASWHMGLLYLAIVVIWQFARVRRVWPLVLFLAIVSVLVPVVVARATLQQVAVLEAGREQVTVVRERGTVAVLVDVAPERGNDDEAVERMRVRATNVATYTVLPFLRQQGIDRIDLGVALSPEAAACWSEIAEEVAVGELWTEPLAVGERFALGDSAIAVRQVEPLLLSMQLGTASWVISGDRLGDSQCRSRSLQAAEVLDADVLLWTGSPIDYDWLRALDPEVAIASARSVARCARRQLYRQATDVLWTGRDGALLWTPQGGWETFRSREAIGD
ncbi:comEC/Rec2-related protein [Rubidibacter lacunae KORDI 51-2]|uniref:ComEC/Rec2-related protein n=1 Tax=Rubidibacter lacunae KORDI 51-2 TaxID=582515 RepID=U5DMP4_9CHRO|nr:ComEC/Rec2 family competence protein [Rubidibacter lacunae]ERN42102.1 comEC/Rec2-related protein [Rubidibacter lacunae KORDI 51-2]